ncbi:MAG: ComEC/Rec2 family competence protein [Planctomycetes bacterium]|nr:ComEC/Rec2 family competence protein [Planctomycetota bacterium]
MTIRLPATSPRAAPLPRALLAAAVWAAGGVLLVRQLGVAGAGIAGVGAALGTLITRRPGPLACLLPAALGALAPSPAVPVPERAGLVQLDVEVVGRARHDPARGEARFGVRPVGAGGRGPAAIAVARTVSARARDLPLPGDRLRGPACVPEPSDALAAGRRPTLELDLRCCTVTPGAPTVTRLAEALRRRMEDALRDAVPDRAGVLLCHLVLGAGPRPAAAITQSHRATGLAHLLAVSGAHLSLLAGMLAALVALPARGGRDPVARRGYRRIAGAVLLPYALLTGMEPPVLRALVAWLLLVGAHAVGRRTGVVGALALPALLTAALWPEDLFGLSFCLSYAAVVGLWAAGALDAHGPFDALRRAAVASAWAALATAPLALWWFGQLAPWTIVGTPLLGPLVAAMLGLGVLAAALLPVAPALGELLVAPAAQCARLYLAIVEWLATLPGAPLRATVTPHAAAVGGTALLAVALLVARPGRRALALGLALCCAPWFVPLPVGAREPGLQLLDVGHGQAALASTAAGALVLIDCGSLLDAERAARAVEAALPVGPRRIDLLIVSHQDGDHAGGVADLLDRVHVARAVLPRRGAALDLARRLDRAGVPIRFVGPGETLAPLPGVRVAAPPLAAGAGANDASLWTRLDWPRAAAVLPGDAEADALRAMVAHPLCERATALVLPHHGRGEREPFDALLDRLRPDVALVSRGRGGEPVLALASHLRGVPVLTTARHGPLHLRATLPVRVDTQRGLALPRH